MTLFKLSLKNIKKSIKDYTIYFFTLILGVAIFYIFNAIETQTVLMNVSKSTYEIIDVMNQMLSGVSVFVSFILGFFDHLCKSVFNETKKCRIWNLSCAWDEQA